MQEQFIKFIEEKCPGAQPLLIVIRGSQAYGTNLPTSDTDYAEYMPKTPTFSNLKIVLKISGVWENQNEVGVTYKFIEMYE